MARVDVLPRIRVLRGEEIALGPGKADLLAAIAERGSISGAARQLAMSYMRAWTLIRTMNRCFRGPLVAATRGGAGKGAATLTVTGRKALRLYREMEAESRRASSRSWRELRRLIRS